MVKTLQIIGKKKWKELTHTVKMKDFKCVICKKTIKGQYGNNPAPVKVRGKCCDECNWKVVIPTRLTYDS